MQIVASITRVQLKAHQERSEIQKLRCEIEKLTINNLRLQEDNLRLQEAMTSVSCTAGGGKMDVQEKSSEEKALRAEIVRLIDELTRVSGLASKYVGRPFMTNENGIPRIVPNLWNPAHVNYGRMFPMAAEVDLFTMTTRPNQDEKNLISEFVIKGTNELLRLAQRDEPLWMPSTDGTTSELCYPEYNRMISGNPFWQQPHRFKLEVSRCSAIVTISRALIVEMLMNLNQWSKIFSSIVTRYMDLEVLVTNSSGDHNGALQLIVAEFQLPSPIMPTRSNYFARHCKMLTNGMWLIVDVPLEGVRPGLVTRLHRRPSGCLIEELPDGSSKVTWVEHLEVDDALVHHIYKPYVNSGLAFGAQCWLGTFKEQCDRLASLAVCILSTDLTHIGIANQEGKQSMINLAGRIVRSFHEGVSSTLAHKWNLLAGIGVDDVRLMNKRFSDELGRPNGLALCTSSSFWVPASPKSVFDFLCQVSTRHEWDIHCMAPAKLITHIATGREFAISLYRIIGVQKENITLLQETGADASGFYVIYAPLDGSSLNMVVAGSDSAAVPITPSGVSILPDGNGGNGGIGGSIVTVCLQMLVDSNPTAELSMTTLATIHSYASCTVDRIKSHAMDIFNASLQLENEIQVAGNNSGTDGQKN